MEADDSDIAADLRALVCVELLPKLLLVGNWKRAPKFQEHFA
jgi:hypothetical protein